MYTTYEILILIGSYSSAILCIIITIQKISLKLEKLLFKIFVLITIVTIILIHLWFLNTLNSTF